jgi:hypothetical protein
MMNNPSADFQPTEPMAYSITVTVSRRQVNLTYAYLDWQIISNVEQLTLE